MTKRWYLKALIESAGIVSVIPLFKLCCLRSPPSALSFLPSPCPLPSDLSPLTSPPAFRATPRDIPEAGSGVRVKKGSSHGVAGLSCGFMQLGAERKTKPG